MINYYLLEQNKKNCNLGLSKKVFETIGNKVLSKVKSNSLEDKNDIKKNYCSASVLFNKISFNFYLTLNNKDVDKEELKKEINELLSDEMLALLDGIPFEVTFKFSSKKVTK